MILPTHEQSWPSLLIKARLEEYVIADGPPTVSRSARVLVTGHQVLDAVMTAQLERNLHNVDPRYHVGTCFHEAGCSNEWDTEIATPSSPHGFVSVGAYQIGEEEAGRYGYALADMLDLAKASDCMVRMAEDNLRGVLQYVDASTRAGQASLLDYTDAHGTLWKNGGVRAYLALAHNHGLGYVRKTVASYGLDWARYRQRNLHTDHVVDHGYGDDCVTGGPYYPANLAP